MQKIYSEYRNKGRNAMKKLIKLTGKAEDRKWLITSIAAGIAILAAIISIVVYMNKKGDEVAEFEEDYYVE